MSALGNILQSLDSREDSICDGYDAMLKRRVSSTTRRVLREVCTHKSMGLSVWLTMKQMDGEPKGNGEEKKEYELVFCRLDGFSHVLYVTAV